MIKMIHGNASTDIQNLEGTGLDCMYVFAVFVLLHVPFVMNTEAEINQAYEDYNNGKFGYLED
jgi:hypothetical protein